MVDLKELQKEIDNLLDNETDESLLNWYMSKQFPTVKELLGEGVFSELQGIESINSQVETVPATTILSLDDIKFHAGNTQYAMAA